MNKKYFSTLIVSLLIMGSFAGLNAIPTVKAAPMDWAGARSSTYGIKPFPSPGGWENAIKTMQANWPESIPTAVWIVGILNATGRYRSHYTEWTDCILQFPSNGSSYPYITFSNTDFHEPYLAYFDTVGVKVFLQVEPGLADVPTLIDLVLNRYGHHSCVIGFGIDVEWHRQAENIWGVPVTDAEAQAWEAQVKAHNSSYRFFLKHFWYTFLPPTYRGDIIFVDDSQGVGSLDRMLYYFMDTWAVKFYPNDVMYQVGYEADKKWWGRLADPPKEIGDAIRAALPPEQGCGVLWVDFTLRDVLPTEPASGVVHVASIDMTGTKSGPNWKASATVTIINDNNYPVTATVYGSWSGAWTGDVSGTTDAYGQVTLVSGGVRGGGTFTFTVTSIVKSGWTYDSSKNVETSDTITLP